MRTANTTPVRTAGRASNLRSALRANRSARRRRADVQPAGSFYGDKSGASGRSTRRRPSQRREPLAYVTIFVIVAIPGLIASLLTRLKPRDRALHWGRRPTAHRWQLTRGRRQRGRQRATRAS